MAKYLKNSQGMTISPTKARSEMLHSIKRKKRHATNQDRYTGRKLTRLCPKCSAEIKKKRVLHRNDAIGIFRDNTTVFICESCNAVWLSKQTIKVWEVLKKSSPKISNKQFKETLRTF